MKQFIALLPLPILTLTFAVTWAAPKQVFDVKVLERQNSETAYSATMPSQTTATASAAPGGAASVQVTTVGGRTRSQQVRGATLSLLLPDGRVAVVNCESKYAPRGNSINRRSCRIPYTEEVRAEFDGDKAKLSWVKSLDGTQTESETYKLLSVVAASNQAR